MSSVDLKVVLLGHKNVGKTSLFNRYVYDEFGKTSMTIGAYFAMKQCRIKDRTYNLAIWDTAGEEKFDSLTSFYCRKARTALITYDITQRSTFDGLSRWVDKVSTEADEDCVVMLVGNKLDLVVDDPQRRKVGFEEARSYAAKIGADVIEASALSGYNVKEFFENVVMKSLERQGSLQPHQRDTVRVKRSSDSESTCCK